MLHRNQDSSSANSPVNSKDRPQPPPSVNSDQKADRKRGHNRPRNSVSGLCWMGSRPYNHGNSKCRKIVKCSAPIRNISSRAWSILNLGHNLGLKLSSAARQLAAVVRPVLKLVSLSSRNSSFGHKTKLKLNSAHKLNARI
jgi:hypothetical protein